MLSLFAQSVWMRSWSFTEMAIAVVIIAAIVALVFVALKQFGIAIPGWVATCFWIVVIAAVVIFSIRLVASL
jgi:hypothetical protein